MRRSQVSDFGLARVCEKTMTDSGHWGTVHYMAPESFEGTLTRDMDVYAFGVTLWQVCAEAATCCFGQERRVRGICIVCQGDGAAGWCHTLMLACCIDVMSS